jgi:hypothetical protein
MGKSEVHDSYCLKSPIPRLWPFATGRGFLARKVEDFGLCWWRGDRLNESRKPQLRELVGRTKLAYVAPLRNSEATRCRQILDTLGSPFVVHLWDILDDKLNDDYTWLFSHAMHVFCLSEAMLDRVHQLARCEASILPFIRPKSIYRARANRDQDAFVIGLLGFLAAYKDGLELLAAATDALMACGLRVRIKIIGPRENLALLPSSLKPLVEYSGFLDDDARDKVLASCDAGYLPGPHQPPQHDLRSRYSIPSRMADFLAAALPVIASVHEASATASAFSSLDGCGFFPARDAGEICAAVQRLLDIDFWSHASDNCLDFFGESYSKDVVLSRFRTIMDTLC